MTLTSIAADREAGRTAVLVIAPSLSILGGQAIQAKRLVDRMSATSRFEISLLPVNPQLPGVFGALQRVKYVRTVVTSIAYVASLVRTVPRHDVVHAFSASYYSYLLAPLPALIVSRLFRRPSVLNYHSGEASDHLRRWPLSRWTMAKLPTAIVVPSGYLVDVFAQFGLHASAIVNFVPLDVLNYRARTPLRPRIFSNRNLEALYNVACTLRAFRRIQDVHPDATLTVAGDGSQRRALEALARELSLDKVRFIGRVDPQRMAALYDEHDIYVSTPDVDNMPLSVLEAFACGLPVVSTRAGGVPYIVDHERTGLLADCGDHDGVADRVLALLRAPDRAAEIAATARRECESRYVWHEVQRCWEDCYARLAPEPKR